MMRAIVIAAVLAAPATAAADGNIGLADLGLHVIGGGVQHATSPTIAWQVDLDYYSPWTEMLHQGNPINDVVGAVVRVRPMFYYMEAGVGPWLSPFVQGGVGFGVVGAGRHAGPVFAAGASLGYSLLIRRVVVLAIGVGVQYHYANFDATDVKTPSFSGLWPHADLMVGYAF
jgi:hypothetical protein